MNLEDLMFNETSQTQKDKPCMMPQRRGKSRRVKCIDTERRVWSPGTRGRGCWEFVFNGTKSVGEERKSWRWMVMMAV